MMNLKELLMCFQGNGDVLSPWDGRPMIRACEKTCKRDLDYRVYSPYYSYIFREKSC